MANFMGRSVPPVHICSLGGGRLPWLQRTRGSANAPYFNRQPCPTAQENGRGHQNFRGTGFNH